MKNNQNQFDVLVVGSGPAGVHAAIPAVKVGLNVAIIDGGLDSTKQDSKISNFLDSNFRKTSNAANLIKNSSYVFNKTYELLKIKSNIEIIQSLAKGGLSEQWHGICDFFSEQELETIGLPADGIQKEYKEVAKLINLKLNTDLDFQSSLLLKAYQNKVNFKSKLYQVPVALSYRTSSVIDELKQFKNFTYIPDQLVFTVKDKTKYVEIDSFSIDKSQKVKTRANFLILAAGSINTTRILLRSLNLFNYKTTFLTKDNYLTVCIQPRILMKINKQKANLSGQLVISSKETSNALETFFIQLYKLNPKSIHKIFAKIPFISFFASTFMIADIRFPAFESDKKFCRLIKGGNGKDVLEISFQESSEELVDHKNKFRKIVQQLRSLGLFPIRTINDYTTSHYAGGVPFQPKAGKLSVDINGKLHQSKRIYVADSSSWRALPAKAPTLTIMANASRVGKNVLKDFKSIYQTTD